MEKTLKQNEIDALFQAALSAAPETQKTVARARVARWERLPQRPWDGG
jgi:hypothetical protein